MMPSGTEIREAREAVQRILDGMGLRSFVYTLEPKEGPWQLRIEYTEDGEWQSCTASMDPVLLRASLRDEATRERLRDTLRAKLRTAPPRP
jgi:molybdenum cofactor biosynthesis enzyme MoaA